MSLIHGIDWQGMGTMILRIAAILLCLVAHEVCHGLAAYKLGDPTAKMNHRLSLNPLHHLDVFGLLMMVTVGFGWAKPVPVDPRYFKKPKQGMAITSLAGPFSNFVLAYLAAIGANVLAAVMTLRGETAGVFLAFQFCYLLVLLNIGLGVFNLIPFPPLDGSKVVAMFLPDRLYIRWMQLERYGMIILMAILWFGWFDGFLDGARTVLTNFMFTYSEFAFYGYVILMSVFNDFSRYFYIFFVGESRAVDHNRGKAAVYASLAGIEVGTVVEVKNDGYFGTFLNSRLYEFNEVSVVCIRSRAFAYLQNNGCFFFLARLGYTLNDFHVVYVERAYGVTAFISRRKHLFRIN